MVDLIGSEQILFADFVQDARAVGIDITGFSGSDGTDNVDGDARAQGFNSAEAFAILNDGTIETGKGNDTIDGLASVIALQTTALAFGYSEIDTDFGAANTASKLKTGGGKDTIRGEANATGIEDTGAFGLLFVDANTGGGKDTVTGLATAASLSTTDARGLSVGLSDIDDDSLTNPDGNAGFIPAEVGTLITGKGDDKVEGSATVTVAAQDGDEVFFAGANGIVVDDGTEAQLNALLPNNPTVDDIVAALDNLVTSMLDTGKGDDQLIANVTLNVSQNGNGADDDLEVIGDGIENAGTIKLGDGNDSVTSTVSVTSTIKNAKGLADALDNSSVGVITGLGVEVNDNTLFDMGKGNDAFTSDIFATAVDDLSAADGLGNPGTFVAGDGSDTFDLTARSEFVLVNADFTNTEQQEGIADGWENRNKVFLDDIDGIAADDGDDTVITLARAFGDGVLTIADGLESREFFDAGGGDDTFDLTAEATFRDSDPDDGIDPRFDNITAATGLQTEQVDEGEFFTQDGNDVIKSIARANSDDLINRSTIAQGISQITGDVLATNVDDKEDQLNTTAAVTTLDNDRLEGSGEADGEADVQAYGILLTNAETGVGEDKLAGTAIADGLNAAKANGIAVGLSNNTDNAGVTLRPDEAGSLSTGDDGDTLDATGTATTGTDGGGHRQRCERRRQRRARRPEQHRRSRRG